MTKSARSYYFKTITRILFPPIAIGVLFMAVISCGNDPARIRELTGPGMGREDNAQDVTIIYSKNGKISARLFAHEFLRNEAARPSYIDMNNGLKAEFYDDSGIVKDVLTADSSRYYEAQGNIVVWGNVQIVSKKGEQLNTQELIWNQSIEKFFTEKPVKITTPTEVLYGNGMEANSDFSWYRILNPKGTVDVNKGELPQ